VLCSHLLGGMTSGKWRNGLFIATGALMSPTSSKQGESIPGIAHLIHLTA
jgi:stage V sporulation protein AD